MTEKIISICGYSSLNPDFQISCHIVQIYRSQCKMLVHRVSGGMYELGLHKQSEIFDFVNCLLFEKFISELDTKGSANIRNFDIYMRKI